MGISVSTYSKSGANNLSSSFTIPLNIAFAQDTWKPGTIRGPLRTKPWNSSGFLCNAVWEHLILEWKQNKSIFVEEDWWRSPSISSPGWTWLSTSTSSTGSAWFSTHFRLWQWGILIKSFWWWWGWQESLPPDDTSQFDNHQNHNFHENYHHSQDDDDDDDDDDKNLMTHLRAIIPPMLCPTRNSGTEGSFSCTILIGSIISMYPISHHQHVPNPAHPNSIKHARCFIHLH